MEQHFCYAKVTACGRVIEREWGNPSKVPPSHSPFLAVGGSADNKTCGHPQKKRRPRASLFLEQGTAVLLCKTGRLRAPAKRRADAARPPQVRRKNRTLAAVTAHSRRDERAETAETAGSKLIQHPQATGPRRSKQRSQQPHQSAGTRAPYRPQPRGWTPPAANAGLAPGIAAGDPHRLVHQLAGADAAAVRGKDENSLLEYPRVGRVHDDHAAGNAFYQNRCLLQP